MIPTCLNLCSGQRPFAAPFINIDINPKWTPDIVADAASLPMFADASVDLIVIHHGLEHSGCGEAAPMIRECRRILKPGGSLIITVPDMHALCNAWMIGKLSTQLFMTNVYGAYMDSESDRHRWGYDWLSLYKFLREVTIAWRCIKKFDFREIPSADIAQDFWILGVEAIK